MKELSTEQKAKAYDKTLERAKRMFSEKELNYLFPELIESDDEKIRKELIEKVKETPACIGFNDKNAVLTWLEKQGRDKEINNFDVLPGLYKCVRRMFDGTPDGKLLFEVGNVYKCLSKHDRAEFEVSYGHSVYLEDPVVRKHFIPFEKQGESMEINPTEFDIRLQSLIGKFDNLPKEELIGSLSFWLNVVQNNGTYNDEKKSAWSKDDITRINEIIETLNIVQANRIRTQRMHYSKATIDNDINWLESLKNELELKVHPIEWSEEDEEIIECLNNCLDELEKENGWRFVYVNNKNVELNKIRNWLKSLKPQNHWKPTKEQMDALLFVIRHYTPKITDKLAWDSIKTLELMYHELLLREEGYD